MTYHKPIAIKATAPAYSIFLTTAVLVVLCFYLNTTSESSNDMHRITKGSLINEIPVNNSELLNSNPTKYTHISDTGAYSEKNADLSLNAIARSRDIARTKNNDLENVRITDFLKFSDITSSAPITYTKATIYEVASDQLPELAPGMVNVTKDNSGYSFKNDGHNYMLIAIALSLQKIPPGYTISDVYTFRFEKRLGQWIKMKRDSIDNNNVVYSISKEDGDYVNAIITGPEAPETQGYVPTTMNDIKVGDPASMVQLIAPPIQNNHGSATVSYRIQTLPGRLGVQPSLNISYNSDGSGSGWLGEGWTLSGMSSITVDTRWIVSRYNETYETETYSLDGQMLAFKQKNISKTANRFIDVKRDAITNNSNITEFYVRKEGSFNRIQRIGDKPNNYYWIITDKNGTKFYYGWYLNFKESAIFRKAVSPEGIAEWKLVRVEDRFGNYMEYEYEKEVGKQYTFNYPKSISYTLHKDDPTLSYHKTIFEYEKSLRIDSLMPNGRNAFITNANSRRLKKIVLLRVLNQAIDTNLTHIYTFDYKNAIFGKSILSSITRSGDDNSEFNSYTFSYHNEDETTPYYLAASSIKVNDKGIRGNLPTILGITNNNSTAIGGSKSSSNSTSVYLGVGSGNPASVDISGGIQYNNTSSSSSGVNTLVDIDGDGRPDKVYIKDNVLQYEKNRSTLTEIAFDTNSIKIRGVNKFMEENSRTTGWGARANFGVTLGYDQARNETVVNTYFTDVNGDGLMDVVNGGSVYFNTGKISGNDLIFSLYSSETPYLVTGTGAISTSFTYDNSADRELVKNNPLHEVVRTWEAPFKGVVNIKDTVRLVEPKFPNSDYDSADGAWVRIDYGNSFKEVELKKADHDKKLLEINGIKVEKGDKVFFRIQSGKLDDDNGAYDQVISNPTITFTSSDVMGADTVDTISPMQRYVYQSSKDFLVSNPVAVSIPDGVNSLKFSGFFSKDRTIDTVTLQVLELKKDFSKPYKDKFNNLVRDSLGNIVYEFSYSKTLFEKKLKPEETSAKINIPSSINISNTDRKIQCIVKSDVNIDLHAVIWNPEISFQQPFIKTCFDSTNTPFECGDTTISQKVAVIPYYVFNDSLKFVGTYESAPTDTTYIFFPYLTLQNNSVDSSFIFSVKTTSRVLGKQLISYKGGRLTNYTPLVVSLKKNQPFIASIESDSTSIGKLKDNAYLSVCDRVLNAEYYFPGRKANAFFSRISSIPNDDPGYFIPVIKDGYYKLIPELSVANDTTKGIIAMRIWVNNIKVDLQKQDSLILYDRGNFQYPLNYISLKLKDNDKITLQFICKGDTLDRNSTLVKTFTINESFPAEFWVNRRNETLGPMYRNWGQFVYNGMNGRSNTNIVPSDLKLDNATALAIDVDGFRHSVKNSYDMQQPVSRNASLDRLSTSNAIFIPMVPYADSLRRCWLGGEDSIYSFSAKTSTSRLGIDNVKSFNPFKVTTSAKDNSSFARGIPKVSVSTSNTYSAGAFVLSKSNTDGSAEQVSDFMDMNGDRHPDIVSRRGIQLTDPTGNLSTWSGNSQTTHQASNKSEGLSVSGTSGGSKSETVVFAGKNKSSAAALINGESSSSATQTSSSNIGASGAYNDGGDNVKFTWMDMNADGLPDKVDASGYFLNKGHDNFEYFTQTFGDVTKAKNLSISPGVTAGYSVDKNSFSGGAGLSFSNSRSDWNLQDMNGDGLPDKVNIQDNSNVFVAINTGHNFLPSKKWLSIERGGSDYNSLGDVASFPVRFLPRSSVTKPWFNLEKNKFNSSNGVSLGGSVTFGFSVLLVKVVINPSFNHSEGMGRTIRQIIDINGDGYVDFLYSSKEGNMDVMLSQLGKTNRLKKVTNPLGGSFTIDYEHTSATTDHPGGKWVMSALEVNDGNSQDRSDTTVVYDSKRKFLYEGGKYDKYEWEFLGFATTTTRDLDFKENPVRSVITKYDVSNYYSSGHLLEEWVEHGTDKTKIYSVTKNKYNYTPLSSNPIVVGNFKRETGIVYSSLQYTMKGTCEGGSSVKWLNKSNYTYNAQFGYVTRFTYKEHPVDTNDVSFNYQTNITYEPNDLPHYIIGLPKDVITQNVDRSKTYRHTEAKYYSWDGFQEGGLTVGNRRSIRTIYTYQDKTVKTGTTFRYFIPYGVIASKELANGIKYKYDYDAGSNTAPPASNISRTYTYITRVENTTYDKVFSETKYDYRYGIPTQTRDINGNYINYQLDHFGRIIVIKGPKECPNPDPSACTSFTLKVDYSLHGSLPPNALIAKVTHYAKENSEGIQTINFIDGFSRSIQVKKTAALALPNGTLNNTANWTVSGRVVYDALGRSVINYYPEIDSTDGLSFLARTNTYSTKVEYDILDRVIKKTLPDGNTEVTVVYSMDGNATVATSIFHNDAVNGGDQTRKLYTNGSGLKAKEIVFGSKGEEIATSYEYDPFHQLEKTIDDRRNITSYNYDISGNRIAISHPDGGTTKFVYDNSGRVAKKINANNDIIEYTYYYDRLINIHYPRHPENDVKYVYGINTSSCKNCANRIIYQEDASGAQSFEYGELGEVERTVRTVIAPFSSKLYTFQTSFKYDTWNRIQSITYPDGDTVLYNYNKAGLLKSVTGHRRLGSAPPINSIYVSDIGYDEFEQRTFIKYGNNTVNAYTYEPTRRRLQEMNVTGINSASFFTVFNSVYKYDNQNNIVLNQIAKSKGTVRSSMIHQYFYDNLNQLDSATGSWLGGRESATYHLGMKYDSLFNVSSKYLDLYSSSTNTSGLIEPKATIDYAENYYYDNGKPHQLSKMTEVIHRNSLQDYTENNREQYFYDKNGNDTLKTIADKSGRENVRERRMQWDEENRINAISINGFVSHYIYDANGERTIKLSVQNYGVYVNGKFAGDTSAPATFSLYASPYYSMRNGNRIYSKHIYIGKQRIISQVENDTRFDNKIPPLSTPEATCPPIVPDCNRKGDYNVQRIKLNKRINDDYVRFDLPHEHIEDTAFENPPPNEYSSKINPFESTQNGKEVLPTVNAVARILSYYYHSNHIGSTSLVTDSLGNVVQYLEYLPFGETFIEQRNNYSSQFTFNSKEQDQETGLYYYGARYYDPHTYQWLGIDPMAEKHPELGPYTYTRNNPVVLVDPNGADFSYFTALTGLARVGSGIAQSAVGAGLLVAPEPVFTKVAGAIAFTHGVDDITTGFKQAFSGEMQESLTYQGVKSGLQGFGMSETDASWAATVTDVSLGFVGGLGINNSPGTISRIGSQEARSAGGLSLRPDITLSGGRSGQLVKSLQGPSNSALRGSGNRVFITDDRGKVIWDLTTERSKSVIPGQGFGEKVVPPLEQHMELIKKLWENQ